MRAGDTDFALTTQFDQWAEKVDFVLGTDSIAALRTRAEALDPSAWQRLERPAPYENTTGKTRARRHNRKQEVVKQRQFLNLQLNYEDVAEFTYQPKNRAGFVRMEFKRFLDTVIRIPAMVLTRARSIVVRLVAYTVNLDRFFSAWATTERTHFGYG